MNSAIRVEGVSKRYILRHQTEGRRYVALRDVVAQKAARLFRRSPAPSAERETFWALRDVSFAVEKGESIGIIGRNGAGKSTLLKILSRITKPTEGRIEIEGRVAGLLEVGTGFHPELTGRENIYLNGAILGMQRTEIRARFDEIVAFAEVEKFLDTPVKHFSSGMYMRLAFAVAAHLETEILIVDEVLAVGDAQFQKKCLGKMSSVAAAGRTILFVSHNVNAIESMCSKVLLLESGRVAAFSSEVRKSLHRYQFGLEGAGGAGVWTNPGNQFSSPYFTPRRMALTDGGGGPLQLPAANDQDIFIQVEFDAKTSDSSLCVGYALYAESGEQLYWSYHNDGREESWPPLKPGRNVLRSRLPRRFLNEQTYRVEFIASLYCRAWLLEPGKNAPFVSLMIQGGLSDSPYWRAVRPGLIAPELGWETVRDFAESP